MSSRQRRIRKHRGEPSGNGVGNMSKMKLIQSLQRDVRWYQRKVDVDTFVLDISVMCCAAGYYADEPKNTKAFWSKFAQDCIANNDHTFNRAFYKFFHKKYVELGQ